MNDIDIRYQEAVKRRTMFYLTHDFSKLSDKVDDVDSCTEKNIKDHKLVNEILDFFYFGSKIHYPAKSYFVAIVYAKCMERYFRIPFYYALDKPDLLIHDKTFLPYMKSRGIYDSVISLLEFFYIDILNIPSTQSTISYFEEEYLIGADRKSNR